VLGAEVPELVRQYLPGDVASLLDEHGLTVADIDPWICHTGGPKVIEAIEEVLDLPSDALALTWRSLREVGNLSSASVLHVLRDTLAARPPDGQGWGVLLAMGTGFCAELVLIRW
jgi:alkylresorcinol/alkylpyrone synthase